jgi:ribosome biogenesis GTPase A
MNKNKNFSIAVVATMSAGKSTLLNAMIGEDLLPSRNEACTAVVFQIEDHDDKENFIARYSDGSQYGDWCSIKMCMLEEWNGQGHQLIEIQGNLPRIKNTANRYKVILFDTPGANNALNDNHAKITKNIIEGSEFCSLICVLNASVLGVKDEWRLLTFIKTELDRNMDAVQPIFVINKIDVLDIERGESPLDIVMGARKYLEELGFSSPILIPASSHLSLSLRKTLQTAERMTAKEVWGDYRGSKKLKSLFSRRYKATTTPRQQRDLRGMINIILDFEHEYHVALGHSPVLLTALNDLTNMLQPTPRRKIKIGGEYFSYSDLYRVDRLSGIPYLEKIIENKLNQHAKQ